jgi:hypothetical protein
MSFAEFGGHHLYSDWQVREWGDFHRQPIAPSIFPIGDASDPIPQLAIGVTVEHTPRRADLPFSDPDRNLGIAPDVFYPLGGFTRFGKQIETLAADHEPNLDFAR